MIESTLRFDDVEDVPGLLPLLRAVQRSHMRSREQSGRRPGNEANTQHVRPPTDTPAHPPKKKRKQLLLIYTSSRFVDLVDFMVSVLRCR